MTQLFPYVTELEKVRSHPSYHTPKYVVYALFGDFYGFCGDATNVGDFPTEELGNLNPMPMGCDVAPPTVDEHANNIGDDVVFSPPEHEHANIIGDDVFPPPVDEHANIIGDDVVVPPLDQNVDQHPTAPHAGE
eukprot:Gb_11413 [translate_table: standard]